MGIEPTDRTVYVRPNGFEDRGHHQVCKHFQSAILVFYSLCSSHTMTDDTCCDTFLPSCQSFHDSRVKENRGKVYAPVYQAESRNETKEAL